MRDRRRALFTSCAALVVGFCVAELTGCGGSGPSDIDIEAAVVRYYTNTSRSLIGLMTLPITIGGGYPIGIEANGESNVTEVQVIKRGEPFTPNELQSIHKPISADSKGYPVRVLVKGTVRTKNPFSAEAASQDFNGEADFVLWHVPPDKSKVDAGAGAWVAVPR